MITGCCLPTRPAPNLEQLCSDMGTLEWRGPGDVYFHFSLLRAGTTPEGGGVQVRTGYAGWGNHLASQCKGWKEGGGRVRCRSFLAHPASFCSHTGLISCSIKRKEASVWFYLKGLFLSLKNISSLQLVVYFNSLSPIIHSLEAELLQTKWTWKVWSPPGPFVLVFGLLGEVAHLNTWQTLCQVLVMSN